MTDGCVPCKCPGLGDRLALTVSMTVMAHTGLRANPRSQVCDSGLPDDEALETGYGGCLEMEDQTSVPTTASHRGLLMNFLNLTRRLACSSDWR